MPITRPAIPPFDLANRVGALKVDDWEAHYELLGAASRREVERLLPDTWDWSGKRCLDFGSGAGRALRCFADLDDTRFWGCDIHEESIAWLNEHLAPMQGLVCRDTPGLDLPDESLDLVWAFSVFTHLTDHWAGWLVELHRMLAPGGILIASFLGEAMSEPIAGEPWDESRVGINVTAYGESFDVGGPNVLMSPWWIQARWGRAFDILRLEPSGFMGSRGHGHGIVVARKRSIPVTVADLERPEHGEPREWQALVHQRTMLYRELTRWRKRARVLEAELGDRGAPDLPPEVTEVLDQVPAMIEENYALADQVVALAREAAELEAEVARLRAAA